MNRLLAVLVAVLVVADAIILSALSRRPPAPPNLEPRVRQLETDVAQAQQDIGELKQEVAILARHGQPND